MNNISNILRFLILVIFFLLVIQPPIDLDLGWHLRYGEYFFQTGQVLKENILSFVWPNYQWVQASWGYDLLLYQIYTHFGFLGVSLSAGIITLLIFIMITYPLKRFTPWQYFLLATTFLFMTTPMYSGGLRSQTTSALFFTITILISSSSLKGRTKTVFTLPVIFLLWANMHGGFTLGLIILYTIFLCHIFLILIKKITQKPKNYTAPSTLKVFGINLFFSTLTPLFNPWGLRIYEETFKHSSNINLTGVAEWQSLFKVPLESSITIIIVTVLIFVGFIVRKNLNIPYLIGLGFTAYLAFSAFRFLMIFGIMATFFLSQNIPMINWRRIINPYFSWAIKIIFVLIITSDVLVFKYYFLLVNPKIVNFRWASYCQTIHDCSEEISEIMLKDPPKGNGYHHYNYGGYLSWRVPTVKTFLDGRMAAWEENGQTPPLGLGDQVLSSNTPIPFIKLDNEYHFQWAIVPTGTPIINYLDSLTEGGLWQKRYSDEYFSYYVKTNET